MNPPKPTPLRKTILICSIACITIHTAHGQATASETDLKGPAVRALLLVSGSPNMELVTIAGERISAPFNVGASGLSQRFHPGASEFHLGVKDDGEETGYRRVGKATLAPGGRDHILLLEPVEGRMFGIHAISGAATDFGADSTLFFNASDVSVGAMLGNVKKVLAPGRIEIVPAPQVKGDVPFFQVEMYHASGSTSRMFASSRWLHRSDGRNYAFVYRDTATGRFSYKIFSETISPAP